MARGLIRVGDSCDFLETDVISDDGVKKVHRQIVVSGDEHDVHNLLMEIRNELKLLNWHMEQMTDSTSMSASDAAKR